MRAVRLIRKKGGVIQAGMADGLPSAPSTVLGDLTKHDDSGARRANPVLLRQPKLPATQPTPQYWLHV